MKTPPESNRGSQIESDDMVAGTSNHEKILLALERLISGDSAGFEDTLWLGFGDVWTVLRNRLVARGIVRYSTRDDVYAITERGRETVIAERGQAVSRSDVAT